jgi:hypothetical protein
MRRRRGDVSKSGRLCRIARSCTAYRGRGEEESEDRGEPSDMLIVDEAVRVATDPNSQKPKHSSGERE